MHNSLNNHITWFKKILNPIFRKLGFSIVSVFEDKTLRGYQLRKYPQNCKIVDEK